MNNKREQSTYRGMSRGFARLFREAEARERQEQARIRKEKKENKKVE